MLSNHAPLKARNKIATQQFNERFIESVLTFDLTYLFCGMPFTTAIKTLLACCVKKTNKQKRKVSHSVCDVAVDSQQRTRWTKIRERNAVCPLWVASH